MMAVVNGKPVPNWRNSAAWSVAGGALYVSAVWVIARLMHNDLLDAMFKSRPAAAMLGLGLVGSMAVAGLTKWRRPISLRSLRNFAIQNAVAIAVCLLVIRGFSALADMHAVGASAWTAAVTGATFVAIAGFGILAVASARLGADFIDDEMAADEMRERSRFYLCGFAWMAACGLLLIVLALAGPGGVLSAGIALGGALILTVAQIVLGIAAWRLSDELGRTLSYEAGNLACYLILVLGGGWAMMAHLGFTQGPAPLDWLTLFAAILFVAGFIAAGRRNLLTR